MLDNPVLISVIILTVLSLLRVHVIFALLIAAIVAGLVVGLPLNETMTIFIDGMGAQSGTALSYILLGIFAAMIAHSGIPDVLINRLLTIKKPSKYIFIFGLALTACLSGTLIPVHIAFIPILVPPLLYFFNKLKIDRRALASALTFGLKMPYMCIPVAYGLIFQGIIATEMTKNGMAINQTSVPLAMIIPAIGMWVGLFIAIFITYRKPRNYAQTNEDIEFLKEAKDEHPKRKFELRDGITIFAVIVALAIQLTFSSLVLGALSGIIVMFVGRIVTIKEGEDVVQGGVKLMGVIAFIMLIASGYATILKETNAISELVNAVNGVTGDSKLITAILLLFIGLLVTMGIGTSFGTVPILAVVFVPLCISIGFSPLATAAIIGTAGALGDAGSPASDSTLGPTSGLNADGQHDHIWDTCVPTFIHYNIPLFIFGIIAAMVL
ncbi:Na+/H+ antiporter family protein [Viridibacillus sp. FSL R5-0477]|uniref:Putative sodium-proton antiporter n=1 Tax=Viridibacillus arenosi FSL R5-213 TaxID=1227360 RepID=W4F1U8_9BACL|nr:Na+/H+ antiporter family protein [Viridibacillus arenosi]ETT86833.1 putative sodium-proton antiporter [Viridibacillus arenosi FSL R5-213]OMC88225.1 sodium:proton antiporter [Viridibacillus arenosi]